MRAITNVRASIRNTSGRPPRANMKPPMAGPATMATLEPVATEVIVRERFVSVIVSLTRDITTADEADWKTAAMAVKARTTTSE
jgi:hypothetical protein